MKRSEINAIMHEGIAFLEEMKFLLPPFAWWTPAQWREKGTECGDLLRQQLGWDITDFGGGSFYDVGLLLFTLRNGTPEDLHRAEGKTYAEKVLIVREGQVTPTHFHFQKMEDIIVRGGGNLVVQLWNSSEDEGLSDRPVTVEVDGVRKSMEAGGRLVLTPGESVTLPPGLYHKFWGETGSGTALVGEVSRVNDDRADNRFYEPAGRFPTVSEDEPPLHLLLGDYPHYYRYAEMSG